MGNINCTMGNSKCYHGYPWDAMEIVTSCNWETVRVTMWNSKSYNLYKLVLQLETISIIMGK